MLEILKTKSTLIMENKELKEFVKLEINKVLEKLNELDQNKVYYLSEDADPEYLQKIAECLKAISKEMCWTPPKIILLNKELK